MTLTAVVRAPSFALGDIIGEILRVPYMTAMALVARLVAVAMSLGIVFAIARIAEEIRAHELGLDPPAPGSRTDLRVTRAGVCAAIFVGVNASLTYYGKTTNLDVPYLFWALPAVLYFIRAITRRTPRLFRRALVFAALAIATKDQAYAMFLVSLPIALGLWAARDGWVHASGSRVLREVGIAVALAIVVLVVVDGAIVNPSGFRARIGFLTGSASQDFAEYQKGWSGRYAIFLDAVRGFELQYPYVLALPIALGFVRTVIGVRRTTSDRRAAQLAIALLPILVATSFTVAFNWTARRTNARFLVPQAVMFAIYGGAGIEVIAFAARHRIVRIIGQAGVSIALALAIFRCIAVDANLLGDPRYDAEKWLAEHVRPGDTIEVYGLNVYQPRFPAHAKVVRVGPEPIDKRNPLPGVEELQAPFEQAESRGAKWVVLSTGWVWRYIWLSERDGGRQVAPLTHRTGTEEAAAHFFDRLVHIRTAFGFVHASEYDPSIFPNVDVHGTSGRTVWIYERR